ncbi:MAG: hypothetical protein E6314_00065 [Enterobacter sp.]|uniref:hypothetical protein n=1 Tax=Enterobacteriaceae TaxID=543 RepID=UPI000CDBD243|nr:MULTISPECIES: hypothetical protein [Citrobacter freundii complex]MDU7096859.1 hypothetical protein [Enterobacter sp.]MDU7181412.1 hypothetical protein [Enterobacter roggenkampii]HCP5153103.1 hypothetical protein [Escherichia coli]AUZ69842.1 hypothetical protein C2U41_11050 [Citrobacter freundii complex sp. CFNIH4]EIP1107932.1 hypothetical protein [Citrobacter freundii]
MLINASGNGVKLIESGTFNHVLGDAGQSELFFDVFGLKVKLITKALSASESTPQEIFASVENGVVVLKHNQRVSPLAEPTGMLIPMEIGTKGEKKLYISWLSFILESNEGVKAASTTYSFYEDM